MTIHTWVFPFLLFSMNIISELYLFDRVNTNRNLKFRIECLYTKRLKNWFHFLIIKSRLLHYYCFFNRVSRGNLSSIPYHKFSTINYKKMYIKYRFSSITWGSNVLIPILKCKKYYCYLKSVNFGIIWILWHLHANFYRNLHNSIFSIRIF